jgi:stage II sporulation protein M
MMARERFEGLLGGLYRRNESYLLISAMIFIVSLLLGYAFAGMLEPVLGSVLGDLKRRISQGELKLTTLSIFANNFKVAFIIYAGGIILGAITVIYLFVNGAIIGYTAAQFSIGDFIIYTAPHGVFEMLGLIIAAAGGFRLANVVLNLMRGLLHLQTDFSMTSQVKYLLEVNQDDFKDSLALFGIAVILLLIAAFIEANLTIIWANYMKTIL